MKNEDIIIEIEKIKERNKRVELDKKWETSWIRRGFICLLTYLIVVLFSYSISKFSNIWLSSCVPVIGFFLSIIKVHTKCMGEISN